MSKSDKDNCGVTLGVEEDGLVFAAVDYTTIKDGVVAEFLVISDFPVFDRKVYVVFDIMSPPPLCTGVVSLELATLVSWLC